MVTLFGLLLYQSVLCQPNFSSALVLGELEDKDIDEASGLAASRKYPGVLWTHNDGDDQKLYALDVNGKVLAEFKVKGAKAFDWEDMAIGPGPKKDIDYIYIADIGDNKAFRKQKTIIRFPEPELKFRKKKQKEDITDHDKIKVEYTDDERDAETLLIDPITRDLFIITKRETRVRVYKIPYPQKINKIIELDPIAKLNLGNTGFGKMITAGDISPDGSEILIKDYNDVYYFKRHDNQKVEEALLQKPIILPYKKEPQGEAICWDALANGYYCLSEWKLFSSPDIFYYYRIPFSLHHILPSY